MRHTRDSRIERDFFTVSVYNVALEWGRFASRLRDLSKASFQFHIYVSKKLKSAFYQLVNHQITYANDLTFDLCQSLLIESD